MPTDDTLNLQQLIDRIQAGDRSARRELLNRACARLRRLAARILNESFPSLRNAHELDSVVHEAWLRLIQTVEKTDPPTVADFFRLAAFKVRQVLLDMSERERLQRQREERGRSSLDFNSQSNEPHDDTYNPNRLALWTEFHEAVAALPDDERSVFEMHYYLGIPQVEAATILNLHPRRVSYLWIAATEKLASHLERLQ